MNEILKYNLKGVSLELELRDDAFKPTSTSKILASNVFMSEMWLKPHPSECRISEHPEVLNKPHLSRCGELKDFLIPKDSIFIDMGCGAGYIGILAAKLGARKVYAVDLSKEACELARKNAIRNHVEYIVEVRQGNLFEPLEGIIADVIVDDVSGIAGLIARNTEWYRNENIPIASEDGSYPTTEMLQQAQSHLTEKGKLYFPVLSLANEKKIIETAESLFKYTEVLETIKFPIKGELKKSEDYLMKLFNEKRIRLVPGGSKLCWELKIYEASNYGEE